MTLDPDASPPHGERPAEPFALTASRGFARWLDGIGGSLAFTTYQAGKVFLLGLRPGGRLHVFERTFPRAMGLAVSEGGRTLHLATEHQIWRFDDVLDGRARAPGGHDALFAPHQTWITGDVDAHDLALGADGAPLFVATLLSCIATTSPGHSLRPLWRPPFVGRIAPEDRCHLNGMAVRDGAALYATAVSRSDVADGWRDRRADGGLVLEVASGAAIAEELSMPHSPRLAGERLWLLDSGRGAFGSIDLSGPAPGPFAPLAFCPGYARGLALVGGAPDAPSHAVIGLSLPRESRTFQGLPLDAALAERDAAPRCGLMVVDLASGDAPHWLRIEGVVRELYDVAHIPHARTPAMIGTRTDEIRTVLSIDEG